MTKPDDKNSATADVPAEEIWIKPEATSYAPVKVAEGISYQPMDGVSNLTP